MRGAAAALAGAVLFFLGVLTAAGDGDRVPPPAAIPLGEQPALPTGAGSQAPPSGATPPPATGDPSAPAGTTPGSSTPSVPPAGEEPPGGGGSGGVEEVGGQVDCFDVGTAGNGSACPPGQAKKVGEPPKDEKGGGDGKH